MECRISMIQRFALLLTACLMVTHGHAADRAAVLVTSNSCAMNEISTLDVRKAYLGYGVSFEGHSIRAYRLNSDYQLNQIFFQSVVAMSEKTYERRLLLQLLKYGRPRPREFDNLESLVSALDEVRCSIAYMWQSDQEGRTDIKAIRILWQEN
jgi:hypothetical protein